MENNKFTPKPYSKDEIRKIVEEISVQLTDFIKSGKYKDLLLTMGNLGKYSLTNMLYILLQMPSATTVYGMKQWNKLGRSIIPGSKSLRIFSPIKEYVEIEQTDLDGKVLVDSNGNEIRRKQLVVKGFKPSYVFDISQTKGREIKALNIKESETVKDKDLIIKGLSNVVNNKGFSIEYVDAATLGSGCLGLCNHTFKKIKILKDMSDYQTISTLVHECGHALAHHGYNAKFEGLTIKEKTEIKEVEAESIACVVCSHLGIDTKEFNFSYIAGWADGDISKFSKNVDVICKCACELINGIDAEIDKARYVEKKIETYKQNKETSNINKEASYELLS